MHPLNRLYDQISAANDRGLLEVAITQASNSGIHKTTLHFPDTTKKTTIVKLYDHMVSLYKPYFDFINYAEFPNNTVLIFMESVPSYDVPARSQLIVDNVASGR